MSAKKISRYTVRTSDRRVFRRCLRKWEHMSSMKKNLMFGGTEQNIHFWFGSGIHFALEDYHGYNFFGDPRRAFHAYYNAFKEDDLPDGAYMHYGLAMSMLTYYITWYERHNQDCGFETIWFDEERNVVPPYTEGATPAVEERFFIPLGVSAIADSRTGAVYAKYEPDGFRGTMSSDGTATYYYAHGSFHSKGYDEDRVLVGEWFDYKTQTSNAAHVVPVHYHGTMDKLVIDRLGRWWILDYKTAKGADTNKLDTDDQISAYLWAAEQHFGHPIYGFVYHQLTKDAVQEPKRLKNGELSADKKQKTTYSLLKKTLIEEYGSVSAAPNKMIQFLNHLAEKETPEGDRFIRWDFVKRSPEQIQSTYETILGEVNLMLDSNLYYFPNPTRDCIWDCPIRDMCIAMDCKDESLVDKLMIGWEQRPRIEDGDRNSNSDSFMDNIAWPTCEEDYIPIEELLDPGPAINIDFGAHESNTEGFQFIYGEE